MTYQERQAQGQRNRKAYLNRMNHAHHLAVMFRGVGVGFSFITLMTMVAGANRVLDLVLIISFAVITGAGFLSAEAVLFFAEQTRFPRSRRVRLRDLYSRSLRMG